jgi:hypothetical protein
MDAQTRVRNAAVKLLQFSVFFSKNLRFLSILDDKRSKRY